MGMMYSKWKSSQYSWTFFRQIY